MRFGTTVTLIFDFKNSAFVANHRCGRGGGCCNKWNNSITVFVHELCKIMIPRNKRNVQNKEFECCKYCPLKNPNKRFFNKFYIVLAHELFPFQFAVLFVSIVANSRTLLLVHTYFVFLV